MELIYQKLLAIFIPVVMILAYIYWQDKLKREPVSQLLKGVGLGVLAMLTAMCFASIVKAFDFSELTEPFFKKAANQAVWQVMPEEAAKLLFLWLLLCKNKYFDEHMDGIVYAVAVAMGFALVGSVRIILPASYHSDVVELGIERGLFIVPCHYSCAVFMGYYYSLARFGKREHRFRNMALAYAVPVLAHGLFDVLINVGAEADDGVFGVMVILFLALCVFMQWLAYKRIKAHLMRDRSL